MASIIASAIVTTGGKVLVSRQYQDISRIQIEGLLSAFPKLLGTGSGGNATTREYTVIESGSYRYVFQPAEALFIVVLSTTQSNIVEDLAALRMIGRLLPERCPSMDETTVSRCAFEILFAFDEIVTNGQREIVSLEQISSILEMFSTEEEIENEKKRERERMANDLAKEKAHELRKLKSEMAHHNHSYGRHDDGGMGHNDNNHNMQQQRQEVKGGFSDVADSIQDNNNNMKSGGRLGGVGLSLSSKAKRADALSKALKESGGNSNNNSAAANSGGGSQQQQQQSSSDQQQQQQMAESANNNPVNLRIDEKISALLNREGGVSSLDVRGDLFIRVDDTSAANIRIILHPLAQDFTTKSHPFMNKDLYLSDNVLAIKDNKPYPVGAAPLGVLRWRSQTANGSVKVPVTVNCWPSATGASIEFELENRNVPLTNVRIALPLPGVPQAQVVDVSCGTAQFDAEQGVMIWYIDTVDRSNDSGTLTVEIGTAATDEHFFPARVAFESDVSLAGVSVVAVQHVDNSSRVQYSCNTHLQADEYIVN